MKKGQTEIFGLAIVVLLISVGFLFAIGFFAQKPSEIKKEFAQTEIGSNLLSSMLKVTVVDCNNLEMTELIQDCAENPEEANQIDCDPTTQGTMGDEGSCQSIQALAVLIFSNTLDKWGYKNYQLRMQKISQAGLEYLIQPDLDPPNGIVISKGTCSGAKKASPPYIIPAENSDVWVVLYLCG